jgi:hypothetical protein
MHWLAHALGLTNPGGGWYLAWSGIVGDLPELAVFALVWRRLNCHAKGCWRVGMHRVRNSHYLVCRTHHPDHDGRKPYTAEQISEHAKGTDDR